MNQSKDAKLCCNADVGEEVFHVFDKKEKELILSKFAKKKNNVYIIKYLAKSKGKAAGS